MRNGETICMGCCYDYEGIVTSPDPSSNAFYDDLVKLGKEFNKDIRTLRRECLTHQRELYQAEVDKAHVDRIRGFFREKLEEIESLLKNLVYEPYD